mmetsp:Transcript_57784/g.132724  ORF Transcript_57784/g.132724 Transcript_57784/m.132724 type:complete len:209 (+) Transcript_57784:433-1059(+)
MTILPPRCLRKRHENALDATARLEAEDSAAVVDEVELDITAASHLLPLSLFLRERIILVLLNQRQVGRHDRIEALFRESEDRLGVAVVQVVEEDATKATRLATVLDVEILVGPLLELGVVAWIVLVARLLVRTMEVLHIVLKEVRGRQVRAAAKPPHSALCLKVAVVKMHRRRHRITWVHHRAETTREEWDALARSIALCSVSTACGC